MVGRMAIYRYSGDAQDLGRRAEEGILPILQAAPGFVSYTVAEGDDEIISFSAWQTRGNAEAASQAVADWVAGHMTEIEVVSVRYVDMLFSTSLGVSTLAGSTA